MEIEFEETFGITLQDHSGPKSYRKKNQTLTSVAAVNPSGITERIPRTHLKLYSLLIEKGTYVQKYLVVRV